MFGVKSRLPIDTSSVLTPNEQLRQVEVNALVGIRKKLQRESRSSTKGAKFKIGQQVLVLRPQLRKRSAVSKLLPQYLGPFKIQKVLPHNLYEVQSKSKAITTFHAVRLIRCFPCTTQP
ncbi:hypothetical protein BB558_004376 [Smittium angustum]|uniref:Integrase zinc-binding domain-containing protein n=1 Tax=Smittium angustum TaxID=133377 RepID=A0A2U1J3D8_SMIAN|nr:hypothetical protein BB558_004376 [Smittium angustum]